jgi:hypothetical protein
MSIICPENGLLACSHGPLELAQSVSELEPIRSQTLVWLGIWAFASLPSDTSLLRVLSHFFLLLLQNVFDV